MDSCVLILIVPLVHADAVLLSRRAGVLGVLLSLAQKKKKAHDQPIAHRQCGSQGVAAARSRDCQFCVAATARAHVAQFFDFERVRPVSSRRRISPSGSSLPFPSGIVVNSSLTPP